MTSYSFKPKQFKVLAQRAENQARCCVTIFQSVVSLQKRSLMASDFLKALTMFVKFLFAYQNTRDPKFVIVANENT